MFLRRATIVGLGVATLLGCDASVEELPEFMPSTPHERYEFSFRRLGLETTALGYSWIAASQRALQSAQEVSPPFRERGYFDANRAESVGYRVALQRGQTVRIEVTANFGVFLDVYRHLERDDAPPRLVASADSASTSLDFFVSRSADYVVRIQPELLLGGQYDVEIINAASLSFPVAGHDIGAVRSWFNAPRDGGRRQHHGLDIFAPRGTPVIAAAEGVVSSTRGNNLGGNVVWLRSRPYGSLYYAHLDSVHAVRGQQVRIGDTLGFVGNTGNARTTPPHLHFGIYSGGPTDPQHYLRPISGRPAQLTADVSVLGQQVRTVGNEVSLRAGPNTRANTVERLARFTPMRVVGGTSNWYRVQLPDHRTGFVAAGTVEPMLGALRMETLFDERSLRDRPDGSADVMGSLTAGDSVPVLGQFGSFLLVAFSEDRLGWLNESPVTAIGRDRTPTASRSGDGPPPPDRQH